MTGRPTTWVTNGVVASPHYLASQVGLRILQDGGNALDAAIATNATLNVVYPHQCHVGGDLFAIIWDPRDNQLHGLNASGPAPRAMTIDWVRDHGSTVMPERGEMSVTVPGTVAGWAALVERFGSRDLGALLAPAAAYARHGIPMSAKLAQSIDINRSLLERNEGARNVFLSTPARTGNLLRQPALVDTFERIGREGREGFYAGPVAEDIVETLRGGASVITLEDLAAFQPEWVTPLRTTYRDYELVELPPNTQGPAALLMANIVEGWPVREFGHTTGQGIHAWVETKLRAFHERDRYISDPRVVDVPLDRFLDSSVAARHREAIDLERATGLGGMELDGDTVYLCAVDRHGMAVSLIQSVFTNWGSGVVAEKSGVLFHNRGSSFSLDPAHANALMPGKRPYHTLIPAMLLRDGQPEIVFGTMGADAQAQVHLQLLLGFVDFELEPQEAIETPRWRSGFNPDGAPWLRVEPRIDTATVDDLRQRGHNVVIGEQWDSAMGHAHAIKIDRERGILGGGSDPRSDGIAAGY